MNLNSLEPLKVSTVFFHIFHNKKTLGCSFHLEMAQEHKASKCTVLLHSCLGPKVRHFLCHINLPYSLKKKIQMNNLIPKHDQEQCILGSGAVIIVNPISPAIYCNVFMKSRFYQLISQSLGNYPYFLQLVHSF